MRADKVPTCTSIIERTLCEADDFMTAKMIQAATGLSVNRVSATLTFFKRVRAADVVSSGNQLWWFYTPATDTRHRKFEERSQEGKGSRNRRGRRIPKPAVSL